MHALVDVVVDRSHMVERLAGGGRASGERLVLAAAGAPKERLAHLGAPGVLSADEQDSAHRPIIALTDVS